MKNFLFIGGDSFIARIISNFSARNYNIYRTTRRKLGCEKNTIYLDLSEPNSYINILNINYDAIFLFSGQSNIKECEKNSESYRLNVVYTKLLFKFILDNFHSKIFFFSSSAVFSKNTIKKDEEASLCPDSRYGEHKAEVESYLMSNSNVFIIRLTKLISIQSSIVNLFLNDNLEYIYSNLLICPISSLYLFNSIIQIINSQSTQRVIHLCNELDISYTSFFNKIELSYNIKRIVKSIKYNDITVNHNLTNKLTKINYDIFPEKISDFYSNLMSYEI